MISSLQGNVSGFSSGAVEVDVGGVGYLINVPASMLAGLRLGEKVRILTHMVVREDSMTLYGFSGLEQRAMFISLLGVSGVGPKLAIAILGALSPEAFRRALASGDVEALTSVGGVGKRGAERIIVELKERLGVSTGLPENQSKVAEVREALIGLGYAASEVREILDQTISQAHEATDVSDLVKAALKRLAHP